MLTDGIKSLLRPLPQWSTVAIGPEPATVTAMLRWDGMSADVTADHTVAALKPLVIATSVDAGQHPVLEYRDRATGTCLGVLRLLRSVDVEVGQTSIFLYHVVAGEHRCLGWPQRRWNAWRQNRLMLKNRSPHRLTMAPDAVQQLMIAYLPPRPVVLVSVAAHGHQNMFPMDLIGPLQRSGLFALALRSTNVSAPRIREVRRVALSHMPASAKSLIYDFSEHHRQPPPDWQALPLALQPSRTWRIPVAADALRVQELSIVHDQEVGSHTLLLARIVSDQMQSDGAQLHHTAGFHQAYRRRRQMPFADV